jgi:hypothetical protein
VRLGELTLSFRHQPLNYRCERGNTQKNGEINESRAPWKENFSPDSVGWPFVSGLFVSFRLKISEKKSGKIDCDRSQVFLKYSHDFHPIKRDSNCIIKHRWKLQDFHYLEIYWMAIHELSESVNEETLKNLWGRVMHATVSRVWEDYWQSWDECRHLTGWLWSRAKTHWT